MTETTQEELQDISDACIQGISVDPKRLLPVLRDADRLAEIERQVLYRTEDMPEWANLWLKCGPSNLPIPPRKGRPDDGPQFWTDGMCSFAHAPDLFPDIKPQKGGFIAVPIITPKGDDEDADPIPDCYSCKGTGRIQGFGHHGERCPCLDRDTSDE